MIDNSEKLKMFLSFEEKDFYFLQILKRRKDNPSLEKDMVVVRNFCIDSLDHYEKILPRVIEICDGENARAYFRINKRNYQKIGLQMIKRVADYISSGGEHALKSVFDSVAGEFHSDPDKKWIVDIDWDKDTLGDFIAIRSRVKELQSETPKTPLIVEIPTKNGVHIITRPFNTYLFRKEHPNIDVHKDNPTILYCP